MITESRYAKESGLEGNKRHIFTIILALKQLCVHPMILLKGAYSRPKAPKKVKPKELNEEDTKE